MIVLVVVAVVEVDVVDVLIVVVLGVVVLKVELWTGVKVGLASSEMTQSSTQYGPYRGPL